ncbi:MAG: YbgC/FadM family acyl-CoA thioesterase [Nitrospirota bacterium]
MHIRVYYEDTDCGGVVYYANFLRYFERARTEYLRERGIEVAAYAAAGLLFVVAHAEVSYRSPGRYNDLLEIDTDVVDLTRTSLTFAHEIRRAGDDRLIVEGAARLVCVDERGKPRRLPEDFLERLNRDIE